MLNKDYFDLIYQISSIENRCGIYSIKLDDDMYIGASTELRCRLLHHLKTLHNNKHVNKKLYDAYQKSKMIEIRILEFCDEGNAIFDDLNLMLEKEKIWGYLLKPSLNVAKITVKLTGQYCTLPYEACCLRKEEYPIFDLEYQSSPYKEMLSIEAHLRLVEGTLSSRIKKSKEWSTHSKNKTLVKGNLIYQLVNPFTKEYRYEWLNPGAFNYLDGLKTTTISVNY